MTTLILNRRDLLATGGSVLASGVSGLLSPSPRHLQRLGLAPGSFLHVLAAHP